MNLRGLRQSGLLDGFGLDKKKSPEPEPGTPSLAHILVPTSSPASSTPTASSPPPQRHPDTMYGGGGGFNAPSTATGRRRNHDEDDEEEEDAAEGRVLEAWERAYADDRSWEALQEDESGLLRPLDTKTLVHAQYRRRLLQRSAAAAAVRIQKGLIRYLYIVIDLSRVGCFCVTRSSWFCTRSLG